MKTKIVFTNKPSIVGKNKQMLIYIPVTVKRLVDLEKEYKITLEEIEDSIEEEEFGEGFSDACYIATHKACRNSGETCECWCHRTKKVNQD